MPELKWVPDTSAMAAWNDDRRCWTVAETEHYWVDIIPMIYNHRLVLTDKDDTSGCYSYGWCYPSFLAAVAALNIWDPATEPSPPGAIKQACPSYPRPLEDI